MKFKFRSKCKIKNKNLMFSKTFKLTDFALVGSIFFLPVSLFLHTLHYLDSTHVFCAGEQKKEHCHLLKSDNSGSG